MGLAVGGRVGCIRMVWHVVLVCELYEIWAWAWGVIMVASQHIAMHCFGGYLPSHH